MTETVLFTVDSQKIAHITLNRPDVYNALNEQLLKKLIEILEGIHSNENLRAVVLRGNGKSFCSGADIKWMERLASAPQEENKEHSLLIAKVLNLLDQLPLPTLSYAQGAIRGGGVGLICCSDIVLSSSLATFGLSEVKIGLAPAIISPYVLRSIGFRQARRFMITGESFNAQNALEIGLVHEICEEHQIDSFIHEILSGGPQAIRSTKKLIRDLEKDQESLLNKLVGLNLTIRESQEAQDGFKAFLSKKKPPWIDHD